MNGNELYPLVLNNASVSLGELSVLQNISMSVKQGEFVVLVGPSGCGKSTLLNLISGNLSPASGRVRAQGLIRCVYQSDGLFPWLTVSENILMGLRDVADPGRQQAELDSLLGLIHLRDFKNHYPHELSGGMRQRVELARALAGDSDLLLMDEPFSALDYQTRMRLRNELVRLLAQRPRTVVFVTHDIEEAAQLADRIFVLSQRPASVVRELTVDAPRPRDLTHPAVMAAVKTLLAEFGLNTRQEETTHSTDQKKPIA